VCVFVCECVCYVSSMCRERMSADGVLLWRRALCACESGGTHPQKYSQQSLCKVNVAIWLERFFVVNASADGRACGAACRETKYESEGLRRCMPFVRE
jgi:hypothetical protein